MAYNNTPPTSPPPDILDAWARTLLKYHEEDRQRLHDTRGKIPKMFEQARKCLEGTNDDALVKEIASGRTDPRFKLDVSGWTTNSGKFREAISEINASHAVLYPVVMRSLDNLTEAHNVKGFSQPLGNTVQTPGMIMDDPGLFERLKGSVGSVFRPKYDKEKEKAYSIVNDFYDYMKESRTKWELYISNHWDNISKAKEWEQDGNVWEYLEELEALDDAEMRTMFLVQVGYYESSRELTKDANTIMQGLLQAKSANPALPQMQQPLMAPQMPPQLPQQQTVAIKVQQQDWQDGGD